MLKSHELLGFMSPALANDILNYTFESDKPTYKAVMNGIAESRKVRPVFLERQPRVQRHALMISTLCRPGLDQVAGNLLRAWLVKKQKALLVDFLNALDIPNVEGVVEDADLPATVGDEKLQSAIETILAKHPPEVVAVYLNAFNDMNEANWSNLKAMLENDARLQLGAHA
jgi:hypothetical protein